MKNSTVVKTKLTQLALCLCVVSCGEAAKPQKAPEKETKADIKKPEPATSPSSKEAAPPTLPASTPSLLEPVKIEPALAPHEGTLYARGSWAKDSSEFYYCADMEGAYNTMNCEYLTPDGASVSLSTSHPPAAEDDAENLKKMEEREAKKGFSPDNNAKNWAYGADLELTWEKSETSKLLVVKVGARVRGETATDYVTKFEHEKLNSKEVDDSIHLDVLAISPDGAYLGVVSHYYGGSICTACGSDSAEDAEECKGCGVGDSYETEIVKVAEVASRAYNSAGLGHHKKSDFKRSAALFQKAMMADPSYTWPYYNLACSLARGGEPGVEAALKKAIELGGEQFKTKAMKDKDFDKVRAEPWFSAVTK